jgi:hypothetical protein
MSGISRKTNKVRREGKEEKKEYPILITCPNKDDEAKQIKLVLSP